MRSMDRRIVMVAGVAGALALAGCATQLQSDLGKAEEPCHKQDFPQKTALSQCLAQAERPIWAKDAPQTLDIYDQFAAGRAALAKERDAGTLNDKQYDDQLEALAKDLRARIASRQQAPD